MYSYGAMGTRGGGLLQRLANLLPSLSNMPWQLSLAWHPGHGLTAGIFPGVSGMAAAPEFARGAFAPGTLATPFFPGAFYGGAAPYVQGAGLLPMATLPAAVSPFGYCAVSPISAGAMPYVQGAVGAMPYVQGAVGAMPYMQGAVAPFGAAPYLQSALAPTTGLGLTGVYGAPGVSGAFAPYGAAPLGAWSPTYGLGGAISPLGAWGPSYGMGAAGAYTLVPPSSYSAGPLATAPDLAYAPYGALQ